MAAKESKHLFLLVSFLFACSSVRSIADFSTRRNKLDNFQFKAVEHDLLLDQPSTTYPTNPVTNPVTTPSTTSPVVVTIPATNPAAVTPNPVTTPGSMPDTNPVTPAVPVTNPVTTPTTNPGAQPVTNPVTTPSPVGVLPVTAPVSNPTPIPPATTNAPAVPGQSWCVAKSGLAENSLQTALDYACGVGGADCSAIQQGGMCYNPNSMQNHASYAFNSYYQKNPAQTSCDFGGTAVVTNQNPSTGSCIFPTSSTSGTTSSAPTTASSTGATVPAGSGSPPSVLNPSSNPALGNIPPGIIGASPPTYGSSISAANSYQAIVMCTTFVASITSAALIL